MRNNPPIPLGHDLWAFHPAKLPRYGFWRMMHEARADFTVLLGLMYPLIEGAGSLDAMPGERGIPLQLRRSSF